MNLVEQWRNLLVSHGATGLWPLDDGIQRATGSLVRDLSGRGHHGTHLDAAVYTLFGTGPFGRMRGTYSPSSGGGDHLTVAHGTWLDQQALTVEFWFRTAADAAAQWGMMGRDPGSGSFRPWVVTLNAAGSISAYSNNSTGPVKTTTRTGLDDQQWHHFAWAYEAAGGTGFHMVDGEVDNSYTGGGTLPTSTEPLHILNQRAGTVAAFLGWMALTAFFPSKLTPAQIRSHYDIVRRYGACAA